MIRPIGGYAKRTMTVASFAAIVALLAATVLVSGIAEAKGGGGGGGRGAGGGGKPSVSSSSKPSNSGGGSGARASGDKGLPPGVASPSSPYYGSPRYGTRYHSFSNFLLWSWLFHGVRGGDEDCGEEEYSGEYDCYEEEYVEPNNDFGGWAVTGVGVFGGVFLIRRLWKRSKWQLGHAPSGLSEEPRREETAPHGGMTRGGPDTRAR